MWHSLAYEQAAFASPPFPTTKSPLSQAIFGDGIAFHTRFLYTLIAKI